MRRAVRILGYVVGSLVGLVVLAYVVVYVASEAKIRRKYAITPHPITIPHDSASIAEGRRLAQLHGCTSCHGHLAEGEIFVDNWLFARLVAPNLTKAVREHSDTELEGIIRQGVSPNGRSVVAMPSGEFAPLRDQDLGKIIAYLRSLPVRDGPSRDVRLGPVARVLLVTGRIWPSVEDVQKAVRLSSTYPALPDPNSEGAYLARTVCTACHGVDLRGSPGGKPPDLRIAAGYSLEQFRHLMHTGKALGEREVGLMSRTARTSFSRFTDAEVASLHRYLVARAGQ